YAVCGMNVFPRTSIMRTLTFNPSPQGSTVMMRLCGGENRLKLDLVRLSFHTPIAGSGAIGLAITSLHACGRTGRDSLFSACSSSIGERTTTHFPKLECSGNSEMSAPCAIEGPARDLYGTQDGIGPYRWHGMAAGQCAVACVASPKNTL